MDLVLFSFILTVIFIIITLRLARLVVREKVQPLTLLLCNSVFFALQGCLSMAFEQDLALTLLIGNSLWAVSAAYVFLICKKRKHNPKKFTDAAGNLEEGMHSQYKEANTNRKLYYYWFHVYLIQMVSLLFFVLLIRALS